MTEFNSDKIALKNGKEILLRNLQPSDIDEYLIFSDCIASETTHTLHFKGQSISSDVLKEKFQASTNSPWQLELGGFDQNRLVSHLSFYKPRPHHPYERHTIEFAIKILKNYCSNGLGSKMLLIMEEIARKTEVKRIQALVRTSNFLGINFYRKHGYEIEGVKKQAAFINGVYESEFYIAKILD
jgi:RimJ/RimL family protein N-acetyltransferase